MPDEDLGEAVKAVVQLVDPTASTDGLEQRLIDYCRRSLSTIKCPRSVDVVAELPRHANGKLLKRELKARYWKSS